MFTMTGDPLKDANEYLWAEAKEEQQRIDRSPVCNVCGGKTGEVGYDYYVWEGKIVCEECLKSVIERAKREIK